MASSVNNKFLLLFTALPVLGCLLIGFRVSRWLFRFTPALGWPWVHSWIVMSSPASGYLLMFVHGFSRFLISF